MLPDGEVIALDSAGYGPFRITQPVTVTAPPGIYAGIRCTGSGIIVNAGPGDTVVLRGLTLNGLGGAYGIDYRSADTLVVDRVKTAGFAEAGIHAATSGNASLFIRNSEFRGTNQIGSPYNHFGGHFEPVLPSVGVLQVDIAESRFVGNGFVGILLLLRRDEGDDTAQPHRGQSGLVCGSRQGRPARRGSCAIRRSSQKHEFRRDARCGPAGIVDSHVFGCAARAE